MQMKPFRIFFYGLIAALGFTTLSCNSDDSPSKTLIDDDHIVVVHAEAGTPWPETTGQVSLVELSTGKVTKLTDYEGAGGAIARSGNDLFIVADHLGDLNLGQKSYSVLHKFNLSTGTIERVSDSQKETIPFHSTSLVLHNDKLYFSGYDKEWYICVVDMATFAVEDTIHLNNESGVYDFKFFGEQLFVNLGYQVKVYTGSSHTPSAVLWLPSAGAGLEPGAFVADKNNRILLPGRQNVFAIDPRNFSVSTLTSNIAIPYYEIKPTLAEDENVLYGIFRVFPGVINPPTTIHKSLWFGKTDLGTGQTTFADEDATSIMIVPQLIRYSEIRKQLIVAGWTGTNDAGIQLLSTDGKTVKDIPLNSFPWDVIVE